MMKRFKHLFFTFLIAAVVAISAVVSVSAATSDIILKNASEAANVNITGTAASDQWVSVKITYKDTELAYFNGQIAGSDGKYSFNADLSDFSSKLPLDVTVSYGSIVETAQIKLESAIPGGGGSGGSGGGAGGGGGASGGGAAASETQKPDISVSGNGGKTSLSSDGTKLTITPDNGYEVSDVTVNGISKGSVTQISGLKTGDKVVVSFKQSQSQASAKKFTDVAAGSWYESAVYYAVDKGLLVGVSDSKFAPDLPTNRAMFVTVLGRLNGGELSGSHTFKDVKSDSWYDKSVAWASSNNIVKGFSSDIFGPERTITREQMAVILYNYASFKGIDVKTGVSQSAFTDEASISSWAREAVNWAASAGIIQGDTNKAFNPQQTATRAQVAVILQRFAEKIK